MTFNLCGSDLHVEITPYFSNFILRSPSRDTATWLRPPLPRVAFTHRRPAPLHDLAQTRDQSICCHHQRRAVLLDGAAGWNWNQAFLKAIPFRIHMSCSGAGTLEAGTQQQFFFSQSVGNSQPAEEVVIQ